MCQVRGWYSGAAAYFGWMREAKRENTRCGLRPMSDKAACQKTRSPEGCAENGPAPALLLSHVSIQICSFVAPCRRPVLIATPLYQSRTWCTNARRAGGSWDSPATSPHFSRPVRNAHGVPTFVGASREGFRPGKLLPKQLATGEHFTSLKTCEMFRLAERNSRGAECVHL